MCREDCNMCHYPFINNKCERYCDYYDYAFMKCENIEVCPDGLDNEIEYDDYDKFLDEEDV